MKRIVGLAMLVAVAGIGCGEAQEETKAPADHIDVPLRNSSFLAVTETYGPLKVTEGEFEAQANQKPWSSWWFPAKDTYLFQGRDGRLSPLEKYDQYLRKTRGSAGSSAQFEREKLFDPDAVGWEGLCHAWAIAAIQAREPVKAVNVGGIDFGVGDLKALLVKTYERVDGTRQFGQRFQERYDSDFEDIYPDQFHRFLQVHLFDRKRAFIMDKDPGVAVWNYPIYRALLKIQRDSADSHLLHVHAWLQGASPFVETYDTVGTLAVSFEYTYDLYGIPNGDGSWSVQYGVWTGDSRNSHPDFVTEVPESVGHKTLNEKLDPAVVGEIIAPSIGS